MRKIFVKILIIIFCINLLIVGPSIKVIAQENDTAESIIEPDVNQRIYSLDLNAEFGFVSVLDHKIMFSKNNTYFDYDDNGGQDTLFFVMRFSIDFNFLANHTIIFLYQPLLLETGVVLENDLTVGNTTFDAGMSMKFIYGFPFYRLSYLYDFIDDPMYEIAIGGSMQIRNATISFEALDGPSTDGTSYFRESDIGPVPLIKFRGMYRFENGFYLATELDGIYAPVSYLNGSDEEITGALLDWSISAGVTFKDMQIGLVLRYLGGGAVGTGEPGATTDGYVKNWLHFLTATLGFRYSIL